MVGTHGPSPAAAWSLAGALLMLSLVGCVGMAKPPSSMAGDAVSRQAARPPPTDSLPPASVATTVPTTAAAPEPGTVRPDWLGTRLLELRPDGLGVAGPTPPELVNRRFPSPDLLPPPSGEVFVTTAGPVPNEVAARSSWREECPVTLEELTYLTMGFWGFDERAHTGEMLVNARFADGVIEVFRRLWEERFPIEEMRVQARQEMDAHPTGDGNVTGGFECRPAVGRSGGWSMHAYGLAVDINPFHNPYVKDDAVAPELASAYLDRDWARPGMIDEHHAAVSAFAEMGWGWGGHWQSAKDWMHFSSNGR